MQPKIAILTDSGSDLPKSYLKENEHIFVLPIQINYEDKTYLDNVDITVDDILAQMPDVIPKTSQPSPDQIIEKILKIKEQGYTDIIAISISGKLSGTNNVIRLVSKEIKDINIYIIDSLRISMTLGYQVMHANELLKEGLSAEEIYNKCKDCQLQTHAIFSTPNLKYLIKGGRISKVKGAIGNLLKIVPIFTVSDEGEYISNQKTHNFKMAIKKMLLNAKNFIKDRKCNMCILYGHKESLDMIENIKVLIKRDLPSVENILVQQMSPTILVHTGPEFLGFGVSLL